MSKSKIFFVLCLSFVLGIAAHSFFSPEKRIGDPFTWYLIFLGCVGIGIVLWHSAYFLHLKIRGSDPSLREGRGERGLPMRVMALGAAFVSLGVFRYAQVIPRVDDSHILQYVGQEITVRGTIDGFPRLREKTAAYVIKVDSIISPNFTSPSVGEGRVRDEGKLLLTAELFPKYDFGDELTFVCAPQHLGKYEQYARREGVSAACAFPKHIANTAVIPSEARDPAQSSTGFFTTLRMTLFRIRQSFHTRLTALFPDPYGGLLAGLLYGDTSGFSRPLKDAFRITGISHITALSGYNVTILAHLLIGMLITLWLTRKQALPIAFALIIAFVVLTGAEASVVRAAVMGFLLLGAQGIGRKSPMRVALTFAGAVMLALNPYLLRFDFGFQLSFLATIALLWFSRDIETRTWVRFLPKPFKIREAAAASSAAILFTAPLILYVTGMLGPLSLLVNILVVPVVPFAMAFGFAAVAADFLVHEAGLIISWLARVLLGYIIGIAEYFARFGALHVQISLWTAAVVMGVMVFMIRKWKKRQINQFPPP